MIGEMPRPRPPHLNRETTRHGGVVWYVRVEKGARIRLRAEYGTDAFRAEYTAAVSGASPVKALTTREGTLAWLIEKYRASAAWADLSNATRRQRECILKIVSTSAGHERFSAIDRKAIVAGRDRRRDTPAAARHFVQTMRGLFAWAVEASHVAENPTTGVKVSRPNTGGFHVWTDDECERFEQRWPVGTRERLAYDLLLYTGLRRGDAVKLGRPHVKNGLATIRTEKTGEVVCIPILPPLQASIDVAPIGELTFIATKAGRPWKKESFGTWFRDVCRKAGVPGSAHGLRKAGATRAANNGATVAQLEAIFGWRGGGMAALYTRQADRKRLAGDGASKLMHEKRTSIPAPIKSAGQNGKNINQNKVRK